MGFFRQFDEFDPLAGETPDHPFSWLPVIVSRARTLLRGRSRDEIVSAAQSADWFIEDYFRTEKEDYIRRLLEHGGWELGYLPEEQRNESGIRRLLDDWPAEAHDPRPHIPDVENTYQLEALKDCIDWYVLGDDSEFPNGQKSEYFAVFALWKVADAFVWLRQTKRPSVEPGPLRDIVDALPPWATVEDPGIRYCLAGECAIEAMDALGWAEHLRASDGHSAEVGQLRKRLHFQAANTEQLAEAKAKERRSVAAHKAAIKRHAENHAMKAQVLEWYELHKANFPSLDSAAEAVVVTEKLVPVTFRTAREWIGEYARRIRSARTP